MFLLRFLPFVLFLVLILGEAPALSASDGDLEAGSDGRAGLYQRLKPSYWWRH